jgi:RNA polymerase sigma factor (sigma-70 family)
VTGGADVLPFPGEDHDSWGSSGFSDFFRAQHQRVLRSTYLVVGSRASAEDITQDSFVVAWRHWSRIASYDRADLWVMRVAIRLAVRHARRHRVAARDPGETDLITTADPTDGMILAQVARLPAAQRAAIVLFYYEDRPVAEVAEVLGCAPATARVHLYRARERLRVMLEEEQG